jgi:hypothetical protein
MEMVSEYKPSFGKSQGKRSLEYTLKASQNRVPRNTFGTRREEVAGGWRKLHNEEFHNLNSSTYIIRVAKSRTMRCASHTASMGVMENAYKILVENPERKRPLRRPRYKWKDNITTILKQIGWKGVEWIHLAQDREQ